MSFLDDILSADVTPFQRAIGDAIYSAARAGAGNMASGLWGTAGDNRKSAAPSSRRKSVRKVPKADVYYPHGTQPGKRAMPRYKKKRKKRRKTIKGRVSKLEKKINKVKPVVSVKQIRNFRPLMLRGTTFNDARVFWVPTLLSAADYDLHIANIQQPNDPVNSTYDYRNSNTKLKHKNAMCEFRFKNHSNVNCNVAYQFVVCQQDSADDAVQNLIEYYGDRGVSFTTNGVGAASATRAYLPKDIMLDLDSGQTALPMFGIQSKYWKGVGKVQHVIMGPGDVIRMRHKKRDWKYMPEDLDQDSATHKKGDVGLLIKCDGDLCKSSTDVDLVGTSGFQLIGSLYRRYDIEIPDSLGLKYFNFNSEFDVTNMGTGEAYVEEESATAPDIDA
jgi:hypothetical protein